MSGVQMNKRPGKSRKSELEGALTAQVINQKNLVENGRSDRSTQFSRSMNAQNRQLQIKQGKRRRHPDRVLHQFQVIKQETDSANSVWEQALLHEQERTEIPMDYKTKDGGMVSNQMGLVTTALDNYTRSKGKLERVTPVGY